MSWKEEMKLNDYEPEERFELRCRKCGLIFFKTVEDITRQYPKLKRSYMDEVEKAISCRAFTCTGTLMLSRNHKHKIQPFIGGLA